MAWKTELDHDLGTLRVLCDGSLSLDDLTMLAIETSFLAHEHGCGKILIDLAHASLDFPANQLCKLLDSYAEYHLKQTTRTGIVLGAKSTPLDLAEVLETAKGYSYPLEVLTGEQAQTWLGKKG